MLVVADTSPLHYLILIDAIGTLPVIFDRVVVPLTVVEELSRPQAPPAVREWIGSAPAWLEVAPSDDVVTGDVVADLLDRLDAGERAAIRLALQLEPAFILIDERRGTAAARELGLRATGTLGVLDRAAEAGLVNLPAMIDRLGHTNFRYPAAVIGRMLAEDRRRRGAPG